MRKITQLLVAASRRWWVVLLIFAANGLAFAALFSLEDQFEAVAGVPTFDTQNDLTAELLVEQLPVYQGEARAAYWRFWAFDFVFPFVAALFLAVLWAFCLRTITWSIGEHLLRWQVPALAFLATLFDYGENLSIFAVLNAGSDPTLVNAVLLFKGLKLTMLAVTGAVTGVLVLLLVANAVYRVVRQAA